MPVTHTSMFLSAYEMQRDENIRVNRAKLVALGIEPPTPPRPAKKTPKIPRHNGQRTSPIVKRVSSRLQTQPKVCYDDDLLAGSPARPPRQSAPSSASGDGGGRGRGVVVDSGANAGTPAGPSAQESAWADEAARQLLPDADASPFSPPPTHILRFDVGRTFVNASPPPLLTHSSARLGAQTLLAYASLPSLLHRPRFPSARTGESRSPRSLSLARARASRPRCNRWAWPSRWSTVARRPRSCS